MYKRQAYIRVSTDGQLEYSPDSQLKVVRDYAQKNGMLLPESFIFQEEEGISGKQAEKRPAFMRMIGMAKQKPKPCLLYTSFQNSRQLIPQENRNNRWRSLAGTQAVVISCTCHRQTQKILMFINSLQNGCQK